MDPKLLRMYSDILSEAPVQSQSEVSRGSILDRMKGFFSGGQPAPAPATGQPAKPGAPAAPGAAPTAQVRGARGGTGPVTAPGTKPPPPPPQAARPTPAANTMAARGKVDAMKGSQASASQTATSNYTGTPQTSPAATAAAPASSVAPASSAAPSLQQQKAAAIGGGMQTGTAAGFAGQDQTKDTYNPDTDPTLAAGRTELAKAEPVNVAAASGAGGYAQSATGAEGQGGTQAARPSVSTGPAVGTRFAGDVQAGGGTLRSRSDDEIAKAKPGMSGFFEEETEESLEEELAEAFNDMLRLSGIQLNEKAVSKQQQKFMGMVHAMQKGEKVKGASPELKKVAKGMGKKDAKDFAATKHKGLPQKVNEGFRVMMDEEGHTLEHIVNRFKHEAKTFLNTGEMSDKLYDALYDYYLDRGEMPYGVAKAREGDPYTWVAARFEADIDGTVDVKMPMGEVAGDDALNELALLAGLSESRVNECGDMGMDMEDRLNVSTNMSSDGTKSVNISAQGEKAEELLSMLKLAGMEGQSMNKPAIIAISSDDEIMDEERETQYANTPDEEYETVDRIIRQGNDLNREKKQFANMPKAGDNPMATDYMLDEEWSALYDSILVKKEMEEGSIKGGDKPGELTGTWSADPPKKGQPNVPPPVPMDPVSKPTTVAPGTKR